MTTADQDPLLGGSCQALPPAVVDKYFFANRNTNLFEYQTAMIICGRCAVLGACLTDAIQSIPQTEGVRAGHGSYNLQRLHTAYLAGADVNQLVARRLRFGSKPRPTENHWDQLPDAELIG